MSVSEWWFLGSAMTLLRWQRGDTWFDRLYKIIMIHTIKLGLQAQHNIQRILLMVLVHWAKLVSMSPWKSGNLHASLFTSRQPLWYPFHHSTSLLIHAVHPSTMFALCSEFWKHWRFRINWLELLGHVYIGCSCRQGKFNNAWIRFSRSC